MLSHVLKHTSRKILVCAPSNAAIDEIVMRLISKGGLFGQR
jgi:senataxin